MPSLTQIAKAHLDRVFTDDSCEGTVIVVASPQVSRIDLTAWALNEFAGAPDPKDPFRALCVCAQPEMLERTLVALRRLRRKNTRTNANDFVIPQRATQLPPLREFNYIKLQTLRRLANRFAEDSLDLLVLDERQTGEMKVMADFVTRVRPLLTILLTSHPMPASHPWTRFGEPLLLQGAAQGLITRSVSTTSTPDV